MNPFTMLARACARRRTRARLLDALRQLPELPRLAYLLSAAFDLSNEAIAQQLEISPQEAERQLAIGLAAIEVALRRERR